MGVLRANVEGTWIDLTGGAQGPTGPKGDTGATGATGPQGAASTVPGPTGPQGIQGVKGDTGAQGIQGVKGDTGAAGTNGLITSVVGSTYISVNSSTPSAPVVSATGLLPLTGGTLSGQLIAAGSAGAEKIKFPTASDYIGFWNGSTREGYLQGNTGGMALSADIGSLTLGSASGRVSLPASLNVGVPANFTGYGGLNWSNGNYVIMSNGTDTFVTAPATGGQVTIRGGSNNGYMLNINASGNHTMIGNVNFSGYSIDGLATVTGQRIVASGGDIVTSNWVYVGGGHLVLSSDANGPGWYTADTLWVRSLNDKGVWAGGGTIGCDGTVSVGFNGVGPYGTGLQSNKHANIVGWCRADYFGSNGSDTDTYIDFPSDGHMRLISNGATAFTAHAGYQACSIEGVAGYANGLRLYNIADGNHAIRYNPGINGVEIDGYAKVRIFQAAQGNIYDFEWNGYGYAPAGWVASSSLKLKENIEDLSAEQAIDIVSNLRPVTYDRIDGVGTDQIGFVAEWTDPVAPHAVAREQDGTPKGIDYGKFTPVLTKVMQTVLDRLDALEAKQ